MGEIYVISIKAFKDVMGKPCEEWRYAGIEPSTNYPCWAYTDYGYGCKRFLSVESAEKWFNVHKQHLFGTYYNRFEFDMSTLAIRKITFKKLVSLTV